MKATTSLATGLSPDGARLQLQEHDGEYYLKIDGVPLMSTRAASSEQEMAAIACRTLPAGARVLIGGLGFGFTLRRVLELAPADAEVDVAELLPMIVDWNREFLAGVNGDLLDDPRVRIHHRDVIDLVSGGRTNPYDAILMDIDNSPDALVQKDNARLYSRRGLGKIRRALKPTGRVVFWSAHRDKPFLQTLSEVFAHAESQPVKAYPKAKRFSHVLFIADRSASPAPSPPSEPPASPA